MNIIKKKISLILTILLFLFEFISCTKINSTRNNVTIANWNVQTFFDGNNDGIEYEEFRSKKNPWTEELYIQRLDKLCKIIEKIDADIFVMEELENEKILYDISNRLSHNSWFKNKIYNYSAFGKADGGSIGCGVLSKLKIQDVRLHSLDIKSSNEKVPSMRPIIELKINTSENIESKNIILFVNHWKSKSGGVEQSEKWRKWQEKSLANLFLSNINNNLQNNVLIATGDFNKDINEFSRNEQNKIVFNDFESNKKNQIEVYSPWDNFDDSIGTYYFNNQWSRIDHFFVTSKEYIKDFSVCNFDELLTSQNTPYRYKISTNKGYSDHLPIKCTIYLNP